MKKLRLDMSSEKKTNMREKATHGMKRSRLNMSPDEKTNTIGKLATGQRD